MWSIESGSPQYKHSSSAYEKGQMSVSQRRGVITLLPKEDSSLLYLKNWRPITLLNVDYKIASKAIAKRIEPMLPQIIHTDQTGFIKGRYIGENIRLIDDLMEQTKIEKSSGLLLALDFRKAFDTLEWPLIQYTLLMFNFGESLRRWVEIFYNNIESTILNNGFATNWIKPSRGVRQGCPLSPFLFVLSAELMANKIRQSTNVKGICLFGNELKLSQFADDTNLICSDLASADNVLQILDDFGNISGLRLNKEKTQAMWLGTWADRKEKPLGLKLARGPTRFLGLHLSYDKKGNNFHNFDRKIQKLHLKLDTWSARDLTLFGRVLILKSLGISQLVYSISNVEVPDYVSSTVKQKLFSFLWKKKKDKIKRTGLYQDYGTGGLRMTDFEIMIKALRLAWISRLLCTGHQNWKSVPIHFFAQYGGLEFILNCNYDVKYFENLPKFYKEILMYFSDLKTLYNSDSSSKRDTVLFNNKQILIGGKPFFNKEWFSKGIRTISDLMDSDGRFISFDTFQNKFGLTRTNFLQFYQVVHAIPKNLAAKALSMKLSLEPREFEFDPSSFALEPGIILNLAKMKSRDFYWLFIKIPFCSCYFNLRSKLSFMIIVLPVPLVLVLFCFIISQHN